MCPRGRRGPLVPARAPPGSDAAALRRRGAPAAGWSCPRARRWRSQRAGDSREATRAQAPVGVDDHPGYAPRLLLVRQVEVGPSVVFRRNLDLERYYRLEPFLHLLRGEHRLLFLV